MANAFLLHDRDILVRCDDSVVRARPAPRFVRRARGYTPVPIRLARGGPSVLALGAHLKNTVCLTRGSHAFLSQHIGDLDNAATVAMLEETIAHLMRMLDVTPAVIAHDMHPDYRSTRLAARFAAERGLPCVSVQHHHAHIAAVMAEHGLSGPVIGLALDGVGLGTDGRAWGGELLEIDGASMQRLAHLRELALPGGDRAAREPWRMAASALHLLGRGNEIAQRFPNPAAATVARMLDSGFNSPLTSSMGRWFDAAAGLLGVASINAFEGQAPMLLEGLARAHGVVAPMTDGYRLIERDGTLAPLLDLTPLLERLIGERNAAAGASLFHETLALALAHWVGTAARARAITDVVLAGGCLLNEVLSDALRLRLNAQALRVHEARQAPPNDAGVSLGQAWVALGVAAEFSTGVR